ncbi:BTAD domain-containing putative transcriptional regulator [Amycolatopsis sp. cg5]|uniref:AfsR/SARP family transcriptional regulator n=1 Tax=Amycolatopsis sp. cg5 TaxID=3238802 RepID=UPI0035244EED
MDTRVQLLGPVRAWSGETEVLLGPSRQRAVFAVLAASAGRMVSRSELVDALWGDSPPAQAANSLYTYVSRLRRLLRASDGAVIESAGSGYRLAIDPDSVDLGAFSRLRRAIDEARRNHGLSRACELIDEALALWQGRAFGDVDGPFADTQRIHFEELRLELVERQAGFKLECGRPAEVVTDLSGVVQRYSSRESLHCLMMVALYRAGRQADALALYQETRRHLVDELGLEPGAALRRAHEEVLSGHADAPDWHARYTPEQLKDLLEALRAADLDHADGHLSPEAA